MNFKVKTGFVCQSHDLFKYVPDIFDEKRIDKGIYDLTMFISRVFVQNNMVLNKEVRNIVV